MFLGTAIQVGGIRGCVPGNVGITSGVPEIAATYRVVQLVSLGPTADKWNMFCYASRIGRLMKSRNARRAAGTWRLPE
jgi:hypothetical protein